MHILIKQTVLKSLFNAVAYIFLNILILLSVITNGFSSARLDLHNSLGKFFTLIRKQNYEK